VIGALADRAAEEIAAAGRAGKGVRAFAPAELPWDEMAFWSTEQALRDALRG